MIDVSILGQEISWFDVPPDGGEEVNPDRIPEPEDRLIEPDKEATLKLVADTSG